MKQLPFEREFLPVTHNRGKKKPHNREPRGIGPVKKEEKEAHLLLLLWGNVLKATVKGTVTPSCGCLFEREKTRESRRTHQEVVTISDFMANFNFITFGENNIMLDTPCSLVTKQKTCIKITVTPFSVGIIVEDCPRFDKETKQKTDQNPQPDLD